MMATIGPNFYARKSIYFALVLVTIVSACKRSSAPQKSDSEIVVSAAASLQNAYGEIAHRYEERTGVKVVLNFGASGELQKQIEFGAPADVFASAGEREMNALAAEGLIDAPSRSDFAANVLVLVVPSSSALPFNSFADLARAPVKRISIGNPQSVPAGHYAQQALEKTGLWDKVHARLIFAENVRQVLEYVAHGEVDAGLVYSTDVAVAHGRVKVISRAPEGTYGPIRYPIAVVKGTRHREAAQEFVQFVLAPAGQNILKQYGFIPVK
jgi:molybdate transport system substrate-binding protein